MGSPEDLIGPSRHHGCRRINHWVDQQTETENIRNLFVSPCDHSVSSMISPSSKSIVILCHATLFSMLFHHITMVFPTTTIELKSQMLSYIYIYKKAYLALCNQILSSIQALPMVILDWDAPRSARCICITENQSLAGRPSQSHRELVSSRQKVELRSG